jgi:predicted nucleic acid-binding protein
VTALFDTGVLVDHLLGKPEAAEVLAVHTYGAISVISWVELMSVAPSGLEESTRAFLQRFERLALNEAIADRAVVLRRAHPALTLPRALIYATALVNSLIFISVDVPPDLQSESNVVVPYQRRTVTV